MAPGVRPGAPERRAWRALPCRPRVGTVTRPGLTLAVGEPAINPVPRQMIERHLAQLAAERGYAGGFEVAIGVEGGAELALKTMNRA